MYPKKMNGLCVGVLSADRILFQGPPDKENGGFKQKILHLMNISAPKVDALTGNDEKFGFAARQFLRKLLVGHICPFIIVKKAGQIQLGYVLHEGRDVILDLLGNGYAKLRGDKSNHENYQEYKAAQEEAEMAERGIWSEQAKPKDAFRYLRQDVKEAQFVQKFKGKKLNAIVEQIHPGKAILYFPEEGFFAPVNFSEIQVVILSEKTENEEKKNNIRAIRSTLESHFLHRDVIAYITGMSENISGYIKSKENEDDVRKIMLLNGFAKLGKDAMNFISTKQFMELKHVAQIALQEGRGLWKDQKVTVSEQLNSKSYIGIVVEVNSGDSLTIYNPEKNESTRIYLPNLRSPTGVQPFAYEAKEYLRKHVIGSKVKVQVEFSRKINVKRFEGDLGELKNFIFASVFNNNVNVSLGLLEQGLVALQVPRVEEDVSKYFEELREADEKGKRNKKGLNGPQGKKAVHFNDLSGGKGKKVDAAKCKNIYTFLRNESQLSGVIDLVLNGSRFKIRFNHENLMVIMVLEGVRCLPNEGEFSKASEEALQFSKLNANQRDVEIDLRKVDNKGIFHGRIFIDKKDYAMELLEKGHAVCMGGKLKNEKYDEIESFARKNKIGLWKYNINLNSIRGETEKQFKPVDFEKRLVLLEIISSTEFYLDQEDAKKPDVPQDPKPVGNVEIGGIYCSKFSDNIYYRAKVLKEVGPSKYSVHYIDYGNYDIVAKPSMGQISEDLKKVKSSLFKCSLHGLDSITNQGLVLLKEFLGAQLKVRFKEQSEVLNREDVEFKVILMDNEININLRLIQFGEAECSIDNAEWRNMEENARRNKDGKWSREEE